MFINKAFSLSSQKMIVMSPMKGNSVQYR